MDSTRRSFIRALLPRGPLRSQLVALDRTGYLDTATALANTAGPSDFSAFKAIASSAADAFEVPPGYRAQVIVGYGDQFANEDGTVLTYGYNNDFLAYFPLDGSKRACCSSTTSTRRRSSSTARRPRGPSRRRRSTSSAGRSATRSCTSSAARTAAGRSSPPLGTTGGSPAPGPRWSSPARSPTTRPTRASAPRRTARSRTARGGITPWGHRAQLRGELPGLPRLRLGPGAHRHRRLHQRRRQQRDDAAREVRLGVRARPAHDPSFVGRKHTALGRFRHENTAFPRAAQHAVRPVHGRRHEQRGRLQVRVRPAVPPGPARGEPADPAERHALHRPLGSAEPPLVRRQRRPEQPDQRDRLLARGARGEPSTPTRASWPPSARRSGTSTTRPTGPRTSRSTRTAPSTSR